MNLAFEITIEDLENVLLQNGIQTSEAEVEALFETHIQPVEDEIIETALRADIHPDDAETLDNQTTAVYEEITRILQEAKVLPAPQG